MIEKNQIRASAGLNNKERIIVLDTRQDHNGLSYLIKIIGQDPCWVTPETIEHYWPIICDEKNKKSKSR